MNFIHETTRRVNRQSWIWAFIFPRKNVKKRRIYEWGKSSNNQWRARSESDRTNINANGNFKKNKN